MGIKRIVVPLIVLICLLLLTGIVVAQQSTGFDAKWSRLASGGGERQSLTFQTLDILGQWVFGSTTSETHEIVPDFFWAGDAYQVTSSLYLPILAKSP